jgi:hypothetical protein
MHILRKSLVACVALLLVPAVAPAQEVFKEITSQRLEDILRGLNIQFTKHESGKDATAYDFKTNKNVPVRLVNFGGKDLMVDCRLERTDLETVNRFNTAAKFSRARLAKLQDGNEVAVLESNLDLRGGVTEDTVKHFIASFDAELGLWSKTAVTTVTEEVTFKEVAPAQLEKILKDLKINYKKSTDAKGVITKFDFTRYNFPIRLTSFGGKDLMVDCHWQTNVELTKLNEWNVKRFFVRAVLYSANPPDVALESNLDCEGGVSESIIRSFITAFDEEARRFDEFLKKQ